MNPNEQIELSRRLQGIAEVIEDALAKKFGRRIFFSFFVWGDGKAGDRAQYVSNAERETVKPALEEVLKIWASGMPDIAAHERH